MIGKPKKVTHLFMSVRITTNVLVILSDIIVLLITEFTVERLQSTADFNFNRCLFCYSFLQFRNGIGMKMSQLNIPEYSYLSFVALFHCLVDLTFRIENTTLSGSHSNYTRILRGFSETERISF